MEKGASEVSRESLGSTERWGFLEWLNYCQRHKDSASMGAQNSTLKMKEKSDWNLPQRQRDLSKGYCTTRRHIASDIRLILKSLSGFFRRSSNLQDLRPSQR
jgi:hypothetical protein